MKSVKSDPEGFSFILQGDGFLECNADKNRITKFDMSGKSSMWMDTSPLQPWCIANALNGNILISFLDENSGTRNDASIRRVYMMTPSGDVLHTYEFGNDCTSPALTCPTYMTQNNNSDVCISNRWKMSNDTWFANICVFYEDGSLKFIYRGHRGKFNPRGISCDSLCNILCANILDSTIHVVSCEGLFLKHLLTRDECIAYPWSIALYRGVLWVGSMEGEVHVYRYHH